MSRSPFCQSVPERETNLLFIAGSVSLVLLFMTDLLTALPIAGGGGSSTAEFVFFPGTIVLDMVTSSSPVLLHDWLISLMQHLITLVAWTLLLYLFLYSLFRFMKWHR